jgi:uncharacterized protein with HEPN domain
MPKNDRANLLAILDAITKVQKYVQGFAESDELYRDSKSFDAVMMNFVFIGEMVDRISDRTKIDHPEVDWKQIKDFRNIIAHNYLGIDAEEVWQIVQNHVPKLQTELSAIVIKLL